MRNSKYLYAGETLEILAAGNQRKMGRLLGIPPTTICTWIRKERESGKPYIIPNGWFHEILDSAEQLGVKLIIHENNGG